MYYRLSSSTEEVACAGVPASAPDLAVDTEWTETRAGWTETRAEWTDILAGWMGMPSEVCNVFLKLHHG